MNGIELAELRHAAKAELKMCPTCGSFGLDNKLELIVMLRTFLDQAERLNRGVYEQILESLGEMEARARRELN